jgi:N6-L-threonylcarbamoyladenine synthase
MGSNLIYKFMKILSIDTSCDETAAAVTNDTVILSNTIWSQASLHSKWGGVVPSLAKRDHEKHIDWVVQKALKSADVKMSDIDCVAVTAGPGLAIALEVGIKKAKELSEKYKKPLIAVNHIEGHVLSCLALPKTKKGLTVDRVSFPALGVITSGKHSEIVLIKKLGSYKILATTVDDALGEALDKAARMLGFGYPGGQIVEKLAEEGNSDKYPLPTPLVGQEKRKIFSYSGLKAALFRKIKEIEETNKELTKADISDLAAIFQKVAFSHFMRVTDFVFKENTDGKIKHVFAGGGVMANVTLRKLLRVESEKLGLNIHFPYGKKLYGDNAAMIGIAAFFKSQREDFVKDLKKLDRNPNLKIED